MVRMAIISILSKDDDFILYICRHLLKGRGGKEERDLPGTAAPSII
jgi:hypothetical protein